MRSPPSGKDARPVVEMGLEGARAVARFHVPLPNLDFLLDRHHLTHLEDEARFGQGALERLARRRA